MLLFIYFIYEIQIRVTMYLSTMKLKKYLCWQKTHTLQHTGTPGARGPTGYYCHFLFTFTHITYCLFFGLLAAIDNYLSIINHFRKHFYSFCRLICWIQVSYATWKVVFKFISYYLAIVECILTIYVLIAERAKTTEVVSTKVFPESKHARSESEHYPHLFCCNFMLCGIILEFQLAISKLTQLRRSK